MKLEISNGEYRALDAISTSDIKVIKESIQDWLYLKQNPRTSEAMALGSALHDSLLLPKDFENNYIVAPNVDKRTIAGKELYAQFIERSKGKTVINEDQFQIIEKINESVRSHKYAYKLLNEGEPEASYIGEIDGVKVKARPDFTHQLALVDIKTCQDCSPFAFGSTMSKYKYHYQAYIYKEIVNQWRVKNGLEKLEQFVFIACETKPPFKVAVYEIPEGDLIEAERQVKKVIEKYKQFLQSGEIEDVFSSITMLGVRPYSYFEE